MDEVVRRLAELDERVDKLAEQMAKLAGSSENMALLLKWAVLPLIIILGGLVGIKIVMP